MKAAFLDSNVIIYAAAGQREDLAKRRQARTLIATTDWGLSGQVLAETYDVLSRDADPPMPESEIDLWIERLSRRECDPVDPPLVARGVAISRRYRIGYYDAAIIAAAERLGADVVYSEDLNDGQSYGSVTVRNPFR